MPLITIADLNSNIYPEVINEITRNNDTITKTAINAAIQEAKLYLSRFDLIQLFGTDTIAPAITDSLLQRLLKDITSWHIIRLANQNIDQPTYRLAYEDAVKILKNIMDGQAIPDGWPYASSQANLPDGNNVAWSSNDKRRNYY